MVDVQSHEINKRLHLIAGDLIKIDVNGTKYLEATVPAELVGKLTIKYFEYKEETP